MSTVVFEISLTPTYFDLIAEIIPLFASSDWILFYVPWPRLLFTIVNEFYNMSPVPLLVQFI